MDVADETVQVSYEAITDSIRFVHELENLVGDKVGIQNGPDLSGLTAVLKEMRYVFDQYAPTGLADSVESDDEETQSDDSNQIIATPKQSIVGGIGSRQDVLKTLDLICKYYSENEPSSPVPILLQRAKKLVTADFMQIVQNLLPDGLSQLEQIKGPDPDADQY